MKGRTKMSKKQKTENIWGLAFVFPTILGLLILNIIPAINTIWQSFFKVGAFGKGNTFVGLENYKTILGDSEIWQSLINTFKYSIIEVPISIIISLILAVLLNRKAKGVSIHRAIIFLPMVAAPAAVAMVWRWLFNSEFGLLNNLFHTNINWISNPNIAIYSIAIVGIWSIIGYNMILFIAGLQEIPKDYYEASSIDGASPITQFFKITLPRHRAST